MASSSALQASICLDQSRLSLSGHSCHSLPSTKTTDRATCEATTTLHCHTPTTRHKKSLSIRTLKCLVLVSFLTSFLFAGCNGVSNQAQHKDTQHTSSYSRHSDADSLVPDDMLEDQLRERRAIINFQLSPGLKWENSTVPYVFDKLLPLRLQRQAVKAMCVWMKQSNCIRFVERTTEKYFVRFEYSHYIPRCLSFIGKLRSKIYYPPNKEPRGQPIYLAMHCNRGEIMHELGHTLGFFHEHQRPDRDQFIQINLENVAEFFWKEFDIREDATSLGVPYDYNSIMHYPLTAFSMNGQNTMTPKLPYSGTIGQRKRLSRLDKQQVNNIYQCVDVGANNIAMPDNADIIKDGNWIVLSPLGLNSSVRLRLHCDMDSCSPSDCAGRLFKYNDIEGCPNLFVSIHKMLTSDGDRIIRSGDQISLKWQLPSEGSGASEYADIIGTSFDSLLCSSGKACSLSGACPSTNDATSCPDQLLTVRVQSKNTGDTLMHNDELRFERTVGSQDSSSISLLRFACDENRCDLKDCLTNNVNCDSSVFHLQKY